MARDRTHRRREFLALCAAGSASLAGCSARARLPSVTGPSEDSGEVDDWQYDPEEHQRDRSGPLPRWVPGPFRRSVPQFGGANYAASADVADDASIGLAAGGAADVATFRRNVEEGFLPIPESMAHEGLFYEYTFETARGQECTELFCPTYAPAVSPDPISGERETFLAVGLDSGLSKAGFERPPLNLVIVLDVSGSMSSSFDRYYYDRFGNRTEAEGDTSRAKIDVAREVLADLTRHLRPDDRLGVVLFESQGYLAKPLRRVDETDMDAIREHLQEDVVASGGTNLSAGLDIADEQMAEYAEEGRSARENRTILITDAQINLGETDADELESGLQANAEDGHHTSVVGVGVDFNAELIDRITSVPGANYRSVYTADDFRRRLDDEFEYLVTPLVFDLSLSLSADGYEVKRVYGSSVDDPTAGELLQVGTLFPSPREDGEARGGVVLVHLEETGAGDGELALEASWETRDGEPGSTTRTATIPDAEEYYADTSTRKAVLLARHANLLRSWTAYERDEGLVADDEGIEPVPEAALGRWELQSDPLVVSERYVERFETFREHLADELVAISDTALEAELELLDSVLAAAEESDGETERAAAVR